MYGKPLAHCEKIREINPIPNADRIVLAKIKDWDVIVKKDEFKVGDICVFVEVGSILPDGMDETTNTAYDTAKEELKAIEKESKKNGETDELKEKKKFLESKIAELQALSKYPYFEFLRSKKFHIKPLKMRGVISQGIAFKPSDIGVDDAKVGLNVTERFGITEILEDEEEAGVNTRTIFLDKFFMRYDWYRKLKKKILPKEKAEWDSKWPAKSDEERIENIWSKMNELYPNEEWIKTEKIEGQNMTVIATPKKNIFGKVKMTFKVCSRTRNLPYYGCKQMGFWKTFKKLKLADKLNGLPTDCIWFIRGEHCGEGIQKNIYHIKGTDFVVFDVYFKRIGDEDNKFVKYNWLEMVKFCEKYGLKTVPYLGTHFGALPDVQDMLKESTGESVFTNGCSHLREGIVWRLKRDYNVSFKVKSPDYSI